jgi:hypothetical protein
MDDKIELAKALLPDPPFTIEAFGVERSAATLTVTAFHEDHLVARMSWLDARTGLELVLPIRSENGGGYDLCCSVDTVYFQGGIDGEARLQVTSIERRKPYRTEARAPASDLVTHLAVVHIVDAKRLPHNTKVNVRMVDLSAAGIGFTSDRPFDAGDIVIVTTQVDGHTCHFHARVLNATGSLYGRSRIGCQITNATTGDYQRLATLVAERPLTSSESNRRPRRIA